MTPGDAPMEMCESLDLAERRHDNPFLARDQLECPARLRLGEQLFEETVGSEVHGHRRWNEIFSSLSRRNRSSVRGCAGWDFQNRRSHAACCFGSKRLRGVMR